MIYLLFIIGFVILIKGADLLVDGSVSLAKKLKISNIVIGLTIVAFGTSTPELVVNLFASLAGQNEIAIGNIIGSNIANVFLILGTSAIIYPLTVKKNTVWKEIPLSVLAPIIVLIMANDVFLDKYISNEISRNDGLTLLAFFVIFMSYIFAISKENPDTNDEPIKEIGSIRSVIYIILGLTGLTLGGKWIVEGAVKISELIGVSKSFTGLTIIAIGTSLPELATSIVASLKKQSDIAIGNVVGSNIFNIFWILGLSAVIKPLPLIPESNFDIIIAITSSLLLFISIFTFRTHQIGRGEGFIFVLFYIGYLIYLSQRG